MSKQSNTAKEAMARIRMVYSELDKYLKKLPPAARMTMGDLAHEFAGRFKLHEPDCKALISFYFHTKYEIGEQDFMLRRGRTGGIQVIPPGVQNHGP